MQIRIVLGLLLSGVLGGLGHVRGSLSLSGFCAFVPLGCILLVGGGWAWFLTFIFAFPITMILTAYRHEDKEFLADMIAKSGPRDASQILANMTILGMVAMAHMLWPDPVWFAAFLGAGAASAADTWATEIGVLSKHPRMILTLKVVSPGTSGAISGLGILVVLVASLLVPLFGVVVWQAISLEQNTQLAAVVLLAGALGGTIGAIVDSLLGATVQATYFCDHCAKSTERTVHRCGTTTTLLKGWQWLNNEWVNFFCTLVGALSAVLLFWTLKP